MQKVLFVCLGNICRSPLAEGIMLHLNEKYNLNWMIDSAGTSNYHIGQAPDIRTIANAKKNGVDLSELKARQFKIEDFNVFDKILVMDKNNLSHLSALAKNENQINKVDMLLNVINPGSNLEVPDPYYCGEKEFENVFKMIYKACEQLAINPTIKK